MKADAMTGKLKNKDNLIFMLRLTVVVCVQRDGTNEGLETGSNLIINAPLLLCYEEES